MQDQTPAIVSNLMLSTAMQSAVPLIQTEHYIKLERAQCRAYVICHDFNDKTAICTASHCHAVQEATDQPKLDCLQSMRDTQHGFCSRLIHASLQPDL